MLFALVAAHCLADYPLQGDFLAAAKNRRTPIGRAIWPHALFAHSMIHGGFVWLITGSVALGIAEAVMHAWIDWAKCEELITFTEDQIGHLSCKLAWACTAAGMAL